MNGEPVYPMRILSETRVDRGASGNGTARPIMPASEMSASQRNQTFDATIQQLTLVTTQVNALTGQVNVLGQRADLSAAFVSRSLWQRLRWLVVGR